jgi:hypothetical protein
MRNTADVSAGKPIAVLSQFFSGVECFWFFSRLLRHPWKKERGAIFLSRTSYETMMIITMIQKIHNKIYNITLTAGWSSLRPRLRNQKAWVQILAVVGVFMMSNYTFSRVMAVYTIYYYQYNLCIIYVYLLSSIHNTSS